MLPPVPPTGEGGEQGQFAPSPQCQTLDPVCQSHSSLVRGSFRCIFDWGQPALCFVFYAADENFRLMHNYLTWLLHSPPARAPYVVLFNLKLLIQDGNLQVCMYCMHAQKRASGAPRTHFRAWKISKFPGCMPPTPLTQSILQAPLFVFALAPPPILSVTTKMH